MKKLTTTQKVLIGGGILAGAALIWTSTQPKKTDTYLPPAGSTIPQPEPTPQPTPQPTPTPEPQVKTNYEQLVDYMRKAGIPVTTYTDRIEFQMLYDGRTRKFQFWNNNRFIFYWRDDAGQWKISTKGNYSNGGRVLTITDGAKKGQIKNGNEVLMNIKNAL